MLPHSSFVIKPNKWSKGKGIYIVKRTKKTNTETSKNLSRWKKILPQKNIKTFPYLYKTQGKEYSDSEFKRILLDTLDGKNSTWVLKDKILIEEKLIPSKGFATYCQEGLADIRIIVFNLVPIAAMIRIPTKKSWGKANLAKWGTALGIDVTSGKVKYQEKKIKPHFPENHEMFNNKTIEYREEILLLSSKIQYFVNLWYLALDRVITPEGPKLLEINGRAGLDIQKITGIKIKNALKKINGLKIYTPEKGIEVSKALFSTKKTQVGKENILYLSQMGTIKNQDQTISDIVIKLNLNTKNNYISKSLAKDIPTHWTELILEESWIRIKNISFLGDEEIKKNEIHLGTKVSKNYLIKPIHKIKKIKNIINPEYLNLDEKSSLLHIDQTIHMIGKRLILSSILKPTNYLDELDTFITNKWKYNPKFNYKRPKEELINTQKTKLLQLQRQLQEIKSPIKKIFETKIEELLYRTNLIQAYSKQNYKKILFYNKKLFWDFSPELINYAKVKSFETESDPELLGAYLSISQIRKKVEEVVSEKWFNNVDIVISPTNLSRIAIVKGQIPKIKILEGAKIRTLELKSILAHEINTHLTRYIRGQETERKIFQDGTGFYLRDEEGLAVYNAFQETNKINYHKNTIYKSYFLANEAQKYNFTKIFELINFLYSGQNMETIFRKTMRVKRGIENTSIINEGAIFLKDKIYLDGYEYMKKNISKIENPEILYKGKFAINDSKYII